MDIERVAILGCGYVGSAVARVLADRGAVVIATTTTPQRRESLARDGFDARIAVLDDLDSVQSAVCDCSHILFSAGPGRGGDYQAVYEQGIQAVVRATRDSSPRILMLSSTRVYGENCGSWVDEESSVDQCDARGRAILSGERMLLAHSHAVPERSATVLRLGGIHGPGRLLVDRIATAAGSTRDDGDTFVNLVHRADIVAAVVMMMDSEFHGVINVVDSQPETRRRLYDRVLSAAGLPSVDWVSPREVKLGKRVSNRRLTEQCGLALRFPLHA